MMFPRHFKLGTTLAAMYESFLRQLCQHNSCFGHTVFLDMLHLLMGHKDTTTGLKKEADSYREIAKAFNLYPADVLFLSDGLAEVDAAREAGLQTGLCVRPDNAEVPQGHGHPEFASFSQIQLSVD